MSSDASREREVREIAIAANSGEANDAQFARLDQLLRDDPRLADYAAALFDQQASLAWQGALSEQPTHSTASGAAVSSESTMPRNVARLGGLTSPTSWTWPTIAVGIAFLLGALTAPVMWRLTAAKATPTTQTLTAQTLRPAYEARLIRSTACLWDINSVESPQIGSWLTSGQSLHLLEGLAEFTLDWSRGGNATLSLEGPAAMMLTSEGMPTLRFGRMTATINSTSRPFVLETPVGRLVVSEFGSVGVSAFGNDGEVHVFDGDATLVPAWRTSNNQENLPITIRAGEAVRVQEGPGGELSISRHPSDQEYFVAQLSMNSDALMIPPSYVEAVKKATPLTYWRFERDTWPTVVNQMGPRFQGRVVGALGVAAYHGNQAVEFGVTDQGGEIICNELFQDEINESYSIEFWIKPSHYHVGSVVSFVGDPETPNDVIPHALLLELGGTGLIPSAIHHPGRMRFLHRSPPSNESELGTSCYSQDAYTFRKWQHVVAVKDGSQMSLYIDGALVGQGEDVSSLPSRMRLLIGRLYPSRRVRPLIGQLDELAVYNRALMPDEIVKHYQIVRPAGASKSSI
jgi:hypothetical protein